MRHIQICAVAVCTALVSGLSLAAEPVAPASPPAPSAYLTRLASARIPADAAAVVVKPLDGGLLAWSANEKKPMNPASTMKLVTTYSALHLLGPAFTFRTEVLSEAPVLGEALRGDLYVRGGGDPKLVIEQLWLLVSRLRGFGIREIRGDVVLDKTFFEALRHDPAEFDGEEGRAYNVGPDPLLVNFKSIAITFVPDPVSKVARVIVVPEVAGLRVPATVPAIEGGCGDWRGRLQADINDPMNIRLRGVYPLACGERAIYLGALEHTSYFAAVFRALWERQGGTWSGRVREGVVHVRRAAHRRAGLAAARDAHPRHQQVLEQRHDPAALPHHGCGRRRAGQSGARRRRDTQSAVGAWPRHARARAGKRLRVVAHRAHFRGLTGQPVGRRLEEPVDAGTHGLAADFGRRRHDEGP